MSSWGTCLTRTPDTSIKLLYRSRTQRVHTYNKGDWLTHAMWLGSPTLRLRTRHLLNPPGFTSQLSHTGLEVSENHWSLAYDARLKIRGVIAEIANNRPDPLTSKEQRQQAEAESPLSDPFCSWVTARKCCPLWGGSSLTASLSMKHPHRSSQKHVS